MEIQTTSGIPDEIKNVVELLYSRSKEISRAEAEHLKEENPELSPIVDRVLQLMDSDELPPNAEAFCDAVAMPVIIDDMGEDDEFVEEEGSPLPGELFFDTSSSSAMNETSDTVHADSKSCDPAGDEEKAESSEGLISELSDLSHPELSDGLLSQEEGVAGIVELTDDAEPDGIVAENSHLSYPGASDVLSSEEEGAGGNAVFAEDNDFVADEILSEDSDSGHPESIDALGNGEDGAAGNAEPIEDDAVLDDIVVEDIVMEDIREGSNADAFMEFSLGEEDEEGHFSSNNPDALNHSNHSGRQDTVDEHEPAYAGTGQMFDDNDDEGDEQDGVEFDIDLNFEPRAPEEIPVENPVRDSGIMLVNSEDEPVLSAKMSDDILFEEDFELSFLKFHPEEKKAENVQKTGEEDDVIAYPGAEISGLVEDKAEISNRDVLPEEEEEEPDNISVGFSESELADAELMDVEQIDIGGILDTPDEQDDGRSPFLSGSLSDSERISMGATPIKFGERVEKISHISCHAVEVAVGSVPSDITTPVPAGNVFAEVNRLGMRQTDSGNDRVLTSVPGMGVSPDVTHGTTRQDWADNTLDVFDESKRLTVDSLKPIGSSEESRRLTVDSMKSVNPNNTLEVNEFNGADRFDFRRLDRRVSPEDHARPTALNLSPAVPGMGVVPVGIRRGGGVQSENTRPTMAGVSSVVGIGAKKLDPAAAQQALEKIKPVMRTPRLQCKMSELSKRNDINPRAGFIISMIDGNTTIADILDISAWPESETAALLLELETQQIISFY